MYSVFFPVPVFATSIFSASAQHDQCQGKTSVENHGGTPDGFNCQKGPRKVRL